MSLTPEKIEWVDIKTIKPHPKNPNRHSGDQVERLAALIIYQGMRVPVIVSNRSGFLVAGHGRLLACIKAGLTTIPVIYQDFTDDEQEFAFLVSDNAVSEWASLDLALINMEIENLGPDFDINLLGVKNFNIDVSEKILKIEEKEPSKPEYKCPECGFRFDE